MVRELGVLPGGVAGLIPSAQALAERDHRLEILSGPLAGMYDPQGAGQVVFVVFAAIAEAAREFIHERTLIGPETAANGNHDGRSAAVDGDMLAIARRSAHEPIASIARHLETIDVSTAPRNKAPALLLIDVENTIGANAQPVTAHAWTLCCTVPMQRTR